MHAPALPRVPPRFTRVRMRRKLRTGVQSIKCASPSGLFGTGSGVVAHMEYEHEYRYNTTLSMSVDFDRGRDKAKDAHQKMKRGGVRSVLQIHGEIE